MPDCRKGVAVIENENEKRIDPIELFAPLFGRPDEKPFQMRFGNKIFEVAMYFNKNGVQSILTQFMDLILSEKLSENRIFDNDDETL